MKTPVRALAVLTTGLTVAAAPRVSSAADTYQADAVHSTTVFRVKHLDTVYFWGRFNEIAGTFSLDPADPSQSKLQFQVPSKSVDTGNAARDQHVKGPDFFNVVQFPTISFVSKSTAKSGEGYEVNGDLTLHGVTKPVTVKVTQTGSGKGMRGNPIAGIEATFTIRRSDFGMSKMFGPVGDEVWVSVNVEGAKK
jgi:polyisoprenoid-binding protein YceI